MVYRSEMQDLAELTMSRADLYAQVEDHFDNTLMPRLLMEGIVRELPKAIVEHPVIPESSADARVVHVGSFKIFSYPMADEIQRFGLVAGSADAYMAKNSIGVWFYWARNRDLLAEWSMISDGNGPRRARILVKGTAGHPFARMLGELEPMMARIFSSGRGVEELVDWAKITR